MENVESNLGCYAMKPSDYDELNFFFDPVKLPVHPTQLLFKVASPHVDPPTQPTQLINDYHDNKDGGKVHTSSWSLSRRSIQRGWWRTGGATRTRACSAVLSSIATITC